VRSINLLIEHQCPQCGAPAVLKETDRLFVCQYCKVKSYLLQKDFFHYMLPSIAPAGKDLLFFPYWRIKGMFFSCDSEEIQHRFIDVSHRAVESRHFPISLGLRSQTLKLQFVSPETKGRFLRPNLPFEKVMRIIEKRFDDFQPSPVLHRSHIGETLSLIYSPYYIEGKIYDAVLDTPISSKLADDFDTGLFEGDRPDWSTQFIPCLCPSCGWDLEGGRDALVLGCRNCNSLWQPGRKGHKNLKFVHIPGAGDDIIYLPFWRIKAEISGIELETYADLAKIANLPRVAQPGWNDIAFYFWALAFKVPPHIFLNLARAITLSQPQEKLARELPGGSLYPVTLPVKEAVESLKINLASFMIPVEKRLPELPYIEIKPKSYLLVYIPFYEKHHEFIQPQFHMAINKKLLALTGNL